MDTSGLYIRQSQSLQDIYVRQSQSLRDLQTVSTPLYSPEQISTRALQPISTWTRQDLYIRQSQYLQIPDLAGLDVRMSQDVTPRENA